MGSTLPSLRGSHGLGDGAAHSRGGVVSGPPDWVVRWSTVLAAFEATYALLVAVYRVVS